MVPDNCGQRSPLPRCRGSPGVDTRLCRRPEILSDAAYFILTSPSSNTGNFYIDDILLASHGVTDLETYSVTPGTKNFIPVFFVD